MNLEDRLKVSLRHAAIGAPVPVQIPAAVRRRARSGRLISSVLAMAVAGGSAFGAVAVVRQAGEAPPTASNDISECLPKDPGVRDSVPIQRTGALTDVAVGAEAVWVANGNLSRYQPGAKTAQTVPLTGPDAGDVVNVQGLSVSCRDVWAFGRAYEQWAPSPAPKGLGGGPAFGRVKDKGSWLWRVDARTTKSIDRIALPEGMIDATITPDGSLWLVGGPSLYRLRPKGDVIERVLSVPDRKLAAISARDGELWVLAASTVTITHSGQQLSEEPGTAEALRVDPEAGRVTATIKLSITAAQGGAIAIDDQWVWLAGATPGRVSRVDRKTNEETGAAFGARYAPTAVGTTPNAAWVLGYDRESSSAAGFLIHVNAQSLEQVRAGRVAAFPLAMAVSGHTAWIMAESLSWEPIDTEIPPAGDPIPKGTPDGTG